MSGPTEGHRSSRRQARWRRRVDAPPTNPEADRADDLDDVKNLPGPRNEGPAPRRSTDPRDTWIAEQRPPHWD